MALGYAKANETLNYHTKLSGNGLISGTCPSLDSTTPLVFTRELGLAFSLALPLLNVLCSCLSPPPPHFPLLPRGMCV